MERTVKMIAVLLMVSLVSATSLAVTIRVPSEQATIQQGIDAAGEGDTVLVAAGSYDGPLNRDLSFGGKGIVLESEEGAAWTSINCGNVARGFLFDSGEDTSAVVRGIAVFYAAADTGAGVYCKNGSSPKFEDCTFMYCDAQIAGGALCFNASSPVVRGCYLRFNTAEESVRQGGQGGGIACLAGSAPVIADTDFEENDALKQGGGLHSHQSSPKLVGCGFDGNTLGDYGQGAAAAVHQSDGVSFTDCTFTGNGVATCVGGGLHASASTLTVTDCDFVDNTSGASGGVHLTSGASANVSGCTFVGNIGGWSAAGGLQCVLGAGAVVTNCTFVGNATHQVWLDGASPTLEYCILAFSESGLPVYCETGAESPYIHHCFVFGNEQADTLCGGNFHDIEYIDPLLCGVPSGDATLCADSPCLPGVTWAQLVGAEGQGCDACGTAVYESTWGRVKAGYR